VGADQTLRMWAASGTPKRFGPIKNFHGHSQTITSLVQGKGFFATGSLDGTVKFWDHTLSDERFTLAPTGNRPIRALALAPGRAILAIGDDGGAITFMRSLPQVSYGPAIPLAEPDREEP
jgi:WD40 repeat protein